MHAQAIERRESIGALESARFACLSFLDLLKSVGSMAMIRILKAVCAQSRL